MTHFSYILLNDMETSLSNIWLYSQHCNQTRAGAGGPNHCPGRGGTLQSNQISIAVSLIGVVCLNLDGRYNARPRPIAALSLETVLAGKMFVF